MKDLEGKIVEVMVTSVTNGLCLEYVGRLASVDDDTIVLKPAAAVHQLRIDCGRCVANYDWYGKLLPDLFAKNLTAVIKQEHVASIHESVYTAE